METKVIEQNGIESFIIKYKKWFIGGLGLQIIPFAIFMLGLMGAAIYSYVSSEVRWHPYQKYIYGGYNAGLKEGNKDRGLLDRNIDYINATPWKRYQIETNRIKKHIEEERVRYLDQFHKDERGAKLAEMKLNNTKLPTEIILEKRFTKAIDFYVDYVARKVKRERYNSDKEYEQALNEEAWKVGYEYGYGKGWMYSESMAGSL